MNVGGDRFDVMFLHQSSLMEATKESDLQLSVSRFLPDHFSRPVGETLLFGVDNLVERSAGLGKPIFVVPGENNFRVKWNISSPSLETYLVLANL